ncbi:hypothetical protein ColTof4_14053 [Colletotrichum tofieldiae]|nr:hypothetical protein ColTof3_14689 [Colletotrichum tofieldiae]GKT81630.1 hypothetical protein ColTof4_14053 [Colletotrichum tofieldiae]
MDSPISDRSCSPSLAADDAQQLPPGRDHDNAKPHQGESDSDTGSDSRNETQEFMVFRALRLTLRFHPHAEDARQTVELLFDDSFVPSSTDALVLRIGHAGAGGCFHDTLADDPDAEELVDVCVIKDAVNLFCSTRPLPWWRLWPGATLVHPRLIHRLLLPLLLAVTITIIASMALRRPLVPLPTTRTEPACVCPGDQQSPPSPPPPPLPVFHARYAPIPLFNDLASLFVQYTDLPLPLTVSAQAVVEQHYQVVDPMEFTINKTERTETPAAETAVSIFMADLFDTTHNLCSATQSWIISSGDSGPERDNVRLLCRSMRRSFLDMTKLWTAVTTTLALSWPSTLALSLSFLLRTLREHEEDRMAAAAHASTSHKHASPADDGNNSHHPSPHAFNNQTSYNLLRRVDLLFFTNPTRPGRLASFTADVYEVSEQMMALEQVMADHVRSLGMLINLLREHGVVKAARDREAQQREQEQRRQRIAGGWFAGPAPESKGLALDSFNQNYNRTLALHNTQSTLVWMVGFTRRQLGGLRSELDRIGNYTSALLATTVIPRDDQGNSNSGSESDNWWRGIPWVTEAREAGRGPEAALERTYWYLPAVGDAITSITGLANWMSHETARTIDQWRSINAVEVAWSLKQI